MSEKKSLAELMREKTKNKDQIKKQKKQKNVIKTTEHDNIKFKINRTLNKEKLIGKMFETIQIHQDLIPIDQLRSMLLNLELLSHRNLIK